MFFLKKSYSKLSLIIHFHFSKLEKESFIAMGGIALEYYTLFLYGYSAKVILKHFFSAASPLVLILGVFLSYFIGPLGAIICGDIGDTRGRKKILAWTLAFVAIPSFIISILPSYNNIGITSSILFMIMRSIQTLAFGGDTLGLVTFVLEEAPTKHRGLFGGFMSMGAGIGVFTASLMMVILDPLEFPIESWRWRIPLCFGIFGIVFSVYFYKTMGENAIFRHHNNKHSIRNWPIFDLLACNKKVFLKIIGLTSLAPIITIVIFGFIPNLDVSYLHFTRKFSMFSNTIALAVFTFAAPFFGALSDKIGRKPILIALFIIFIFISFPLFSVLLNGNYYITFFIQIVFGLLSSAYYGVTFAISIEHFPTHVRYTGVALSYYTTYALFGGVNGLYILEFITNKTQMQIAPVFYLLFGAVLSLISIITLQEENRHRLDSIK